MSHTFAGLAMAEVVHRVLPPERNDEASRTRRRLLLTAGGIASNFPDLDLIFVRLLPKPLGYLLHHRGHTHTLLFLIPQGLLLLAALWCLWPGARRLFSKSRTTRIGAGITIAAGLILHILMDALNSYGIHPLHPLDSRWYYGDMVFIVEPFFWIAFGAPILLTINNRYVRLASLVGLLAVPTTFTALGYFLWPSLAFLFVMMLGLGILHFRQRSLTAVIAGWLLVLGFLGAESLGSRAAKLALMKTTTSTFLDAAVHSYPTNPLCWMFVSIAKDETSGKYQLRKGRLSAWPELLSVDRCPNVLVTTTGHESAQIAIADVAEGDLSQVRRLVKNDCRFSAWLRFARMPIVTDAEAHDFRFSTSGRGDFSALPLDFEPSRECPSGIPLWGRPREDLL